MLAGKVANGVTLIVYESGNASNCSDAAGLSTTEFLVGSTEEYNHYGYKPVSI